MNTKIIALSLLSLTAFTGCGQNSGTKSSAQNGADTAGKDPCAPSLALDGTVNYTDTVQPMLAKSCIACHGAGKTPPDLSSYALAKASAAGSLQAITSGAMPPGSPLAAADTAAFTAWVNGGTLEKAAANTAGTVAPTPASTDQAPAATPNCPAKEAPHTDPSADAQAANPASANNAGTTTNASSTTTNGAGTTTNAGGTTANAGGTTANAGGTIAAGNGAGTTPALPVTYTNTIKAFIDKKCLACHNKGQKRPLMNDYKTAAAAAAKSYADMVGKKMPPAGGLINTDLTTFKAWIDGKTPQ